MISPSCRSWVHIESRVDVAWCRTCGARAAIKDRADVELVDLPCFGRPARLVWRKQRWWCRESACPAGSWTQVDGRIAAPRAALTDRAARWATVQVGRHGRAVSDVAAELGCDWHTVNDAVVAYGEALLEADTNRVGTVEALGLDETLFVRLGRFRTQQWCSSIVDVGTGASRQADRADRGPHRRNGVGVARRSTRAMACRDPLGCVGHVRPLSQDLR